jgi:lipopolysaccharide transport system ATP-binding protein
MQLRLAFSVAAHLEPEVLLIDEVLAVGDMEFQKKCIGKMEEVSKTHGRTIVFISHNMAHLQQFCDRLILLDEGNLISDGKTNEIISQYKKQTNRNNQYHWKNNDDESEFVITNASIKNKQGFIVDVINTQEECILELHVKAAKQITNSLIAVRFTIG